MARRECREEGRERVVALRRGGYGGGRAEDKGPTPYRQEALHHATPPSVLHGRGTLHQADKHLITSPSCSFARNTIVATTASSPAINMHKVRAMQVAEDVNFAMA
ncbi:hypothetical protein E2562_010210 [Oryza meyeriana var. granulata]|uniref:Uncharacterized protein n=1 Tax=Oryza meyeriana var. granulata TaxID=110450 RepID=A0A6G1EIS8_9ORYZ|nr:hypothetical protein E2562_010210 [Oryza meyeriana var. granulata]